MPFVPSGVTETGFTPGRRVSENVRGRSHTLEPQGMVAMSDRVETLETHCCITGGGPAGMVLGFLLARAGVDVVVLEKHGDFLRDFRGDTIHPSTLQL